MGPAIIVSAVLADAILKAIFLVVEQEPQRFPIVLVRVRHGDFAPYFSSAGASSAVWTTRSNATMLASIPLLGLDVGMVGANHRPVAARDSITSTLSHPA